MWLSMKGKHFSLLLLITLLASLVTPALACPPGRSPGWWKHQFRAIYEGKGKPHISKETLETGISELNADWFSVTWGPSWDGYTLPALANFDYDDEGDFDKDDVLAIWGDTSWNDLWIPLANYFNYIAGLAPYI